MNQSQFLRGFTIFEVLIVIALGILLVALTLPVGVRFYQAQVVDETTTEVLGALVGAARESRLGKNDHAFGVKFFSDHYVVFEGDQYASRIITEDQTVQFPGGTIIGILNPEIDFAKVSGIPNVNETLSLSVYGVTHVIDISGVGVITQIN